MSQAGRAGRRVVQRTLIVGIVAEPGMGVHGVGNGTQRVVPVLHVVHFDVVLALSREQPRDGERVARGSVPCRFLLQVVTHGAVVQHRLVVAERQRMATTHHRG